MPSRSPKTAVTRRKRAPKRRGGRPLAAEAESRAARLRDVALEVFLEFGFERANLTEIVRRAGASKETLYSRYQKKSDLFVAVITGYLESHMRPFSDLLEERGSLEYRLKTFALRLLTAVLEDGSQNLALVVFAEARRFPELGGRFWEIAHQRGENEMAAFMKKQIASRMLRKGNPVRMAQEFLYLVMGRVLLRAVLNVGQSMTATQRRAHAHAAVATFLRAYSAE